MTYKNLLLFLMIFSAIICFNAIAQTWKPLGGLDADTAAKPIGYTTSPFATAIAKDGTIYLAYSDDLREDGKLRVVKYNKIRNRWVPVGNETFLPFTYHFSLTVLNNIPYLAYADSKDNEKITVIKFNNKTNEWQLVGKSKISDGDKDDSGTNTPIAITSNGKHRLYLAYVDDNSFDRSGKLTVKFFDINQPVKEWKILGVPKFSEGSVHGSLSIAVDNDMPYIVYEDGPLGLTVKKFNLKNNKWIFVGNTPLDNNVAISPTIVFNNHQPYIGYTTFVTDSTDSSNQFESALVYTLAKNNKWFPIGDGPVSISTDGKSIALACIHNTIIAAYSDKNLKNNSITVKQLRNNKWRLLGNQPVSEVPITPIENYPSRYIPALIVDNISHKIYLFYVENTTMSLWGKSISLPR